jgi:hypothetical protein
MIHRLKCTSNTFQSTLDKQKPFEIRRNDRHFQKGDTVILEEIDFESLNYTGRQLQFEIGFVTNFAQCEDYVVFSCLNIKLRSDEDKKDEIPF